MQSPITEQAGGRVFLSRLDWDSPGLPVVKTSTSSAGFGAVPGWRATIPNASQPKSKHEMEAISQRDSILKDHRKLFKEKKWTIWSKPW